MEIRGTLVVTALMALVAGFIVQSIKLGLGEEWQKYWRYIPIPLAFVLIGIGVLIAWLQQEPMVAGGINGFIAAAVAAYGFDFISGVLGKRSG